MLESRSPRVNSATLSKSLSKSTRAGFIAIGMKFTLSVLGSVIFIALSRGCVTPKQIENLIETCEGDTDLIDGYDELPPEYQEKIKYALENGHVADEDWKGVSANQDPIRPVIPFNNQQAIRKFKIMY